MNDEIRKISNDNIKIERLQKRLNNIYKFSRYEAKIEKTKNKKTSLKYEVRIITRDNVCVNIKSFFDKVDILYFIKGLEEASQLQLY